MEKKCGCKGSKGKNYIPDRITLDFDGKEITNRDLLSKSRKRCFPAENAKNFCGTAANFPEKRAAAEIAEIAAAADEHGWTFFKAA